MSKKRVLLLRLDKIGDLICSLPADQVLDDADYETFWVVQKGLGTVVDLGKKSRRYLELDKSNPSESRKKFRSFLNEFKPDVAISLQGPWWVSYELFRAGVPVRAGVKSQWHSFLFLNRGLRQKRSKAEMHELEYNLELVYKTLNIRQTKEFIYFQIEKPSETEVLKKFNLMPNNYCVVHPGMMGSALNWSQKEYIQYINSLLSENKKVVITGTDSDEPYLDQIKKEFQNRSGVIWLQSKLNLKELVQVLAYSEKVLAPSTGVAHLAAAVGAKITGVFSPVTVHHPRRWAPRGPNVEIIMLEKPEAFY